MNTELNRSRHGQAQRVLIQKIKFMSAISRLPKSLFTGAALLALSGAVFGQFTPQGGEFSILGALKGDQVLPSLSLSPNGGCIIWQDNFIDRKGGGVGGSLLNSSFDASPTFRVNKVVTGIQLKPKVQLLADGNTIFVWQGSVTLGGRPQIYARFANGGAKNAGAYGSNFYTGDILVNTYTADQQVDPAVAALPDGSAVITWSSYEQDGSMWGVYARRLSPKGTAMAEKKGASTKQFLVNQYTTFNQRNPEVAALANGNYVITWISEQETSPKGFDVYARIFADSGLPVTGEIQIDSASNICAAPSVAPQNDGGFTVVWAEKDAMVLSNSWDVWGRSFSAAGTPEVNDATGTANAFRINTYLYGDQYLPKIAAGPSGSLVVWTSLGQDGSHEGVYGRYLAGGSLIPGPEFRVNTTTAGQQMHQAVAWNGNQFLVVWTGFSGASGFDLYGQAYYIKP
jgi:hypothetical protein